MSKVVDRTVAITLATKTGGRVALDASAADGAPSSYVFALHKAGSVLLCKLVAGLAKAAGRPCLDAPGALFRAGESFQDVAPEDLTELYSRPGYVFMGLRDYWDCFEALDISANPKLLLVRDPRDILVSLYFSFARSHALPAEGPVRETLLRSRATAARSDIDTFVLSEQSDFILRSYERFVNRLLPQERLTLYRYEDVIFRKRWWAADICRRLQLDVRMTKRWKIARKHDARSKKEQPDRHVRQVCPGNFRRHLKAGTVREIERRYEIPMGLLGYRPLRTWLGVSVHTPAKPRKMSNRAKRILAR